MTSTRAQIQKTVAATMNSRNRMVKLASILDYSLRFL
jgi:hypothetical protein